MPAPARQPRLRDMKRMLLLLALALGLLLLALGAWAVQGVRWTLTGSRRRRSRLATA
jgi:hypothetical protein